MNRTKIAFIALLLAGQSVAYAQSGILDRIRTGNVIRLGYIEDAAPFSSLGEDRQPQGYMIDLCREVANGVRTQLNLPTLETRWVPLTVQNRLDAVRKGTVDLECSTTTWTLSRQAVVDVSLITFVDGGSILARTGTKMARLLDIDGKRVAVIAGTTTERVLQDALAQRSLKTELVAVKSRSEGLKLLEAGKVDGLAADRTTLIGLVGGRVPSAFTLLEESEEFSVQPESVSL